MRPESNLRKPLLQKKKKKKKKKGKRMEKQRKLIGPTSS